MTRVLITLTGALCLVAALEAAGVPPLRGLDLYRPAPVDNPLTAHKVSLGRQLFHDRGLSRDGSMSCATCHDPLHAFADNQKVSRGVGGAFGTRNVPTIINRAWGGSFFWDGRSATLEQQVIGPLLNPRELATRPDVVVALARSQKYAAQFRRAFGAEPSFSDVTRALASYVRSIEAADAPYDRFVEGDGRALNTAAVRGLGLFRGKAGCAACHSGPLLSDERFHNTGVAWRNRGDQNSGPRDNGRMSVTKSIEDRGAFKTPTLREIARTAPYMHDGSIGTLADVIEYYDAGGEKNPQLDPKMRPLRLSQSERSDLLAFLRALTGTVRERP